MSTKVYIIPVQSTHHDGLNSSINRSDYPKQPQGNVCDLLFTRLSTRFIMQHRWVKETQRHAIQEMSEFVSGMETEQKIPSKAPNERHKLIQISSPHVTDDRTKDHDGASE